MGRPLFIVKQYSRYEQIRREGQLAAIEAFLHGHPQGNYFQSLDFFQLVEDVRGFEPVQLLARNPQGAIEGALLGVFQSNGGGFRSWFSRRLIVWGGPLVCDLPAGARQAVARQLLEELTRRARGRALFIEFRNSFDTSGLRPAFEACGFTFKPHLNFLVRTDEATAVMKRMSQSRVRQIRSSLNMGAVIATAQTEEEAMDFYRILERLYREKVKKPLPAAGFFLKFLHAPSTRFFIIRYEGRVVGGIVCPVYCDQIIYEWYVCGDDGMVKGLHPSVLATWAPIDYALKNGCHHFDFMGAGRPGEDYGVRDFKARFGGEEVNYGRYEAVLNRPVYRAAKWGLKLYQRLT